MIFDIIKKRRSIFPVQYSDTPIATADIEKVLEAAKWAPNHKKTEPWRFKVIQGEAKTRLGLFMSKKYKESRPKAKNDEDQKTSGKP